MNENKKRYIKKIRENTAYPAYRALINLAAVLGYTFTALFILGISGAGTARMFKVRAELVFHNPGSTVGDQLAAMLSSDGFMVILAGIVGAIVMYLGIRFCKEASLILADIADSITETNAQLMPNE